MQFHATWSSIEEGLDIYVGQTESFTRTGTTCPPSRPPAEIRLHLHGRLAEADAVRTRHRRRFPTWTRGAETNLEGVIPSQPS